MHTLEEYYKLKPEEQSIDELVNIVRFSVDDDSFSKQLSSVFQVYMDPCHKMVLLTAINTVIIQNRLNLFEEKYCSRIKASEDDVLATNLEAAEINKPLYDAWEHVAKKYKP